MKTPERTLVQVVDLSSVQSDFDRSSQRLAFTPIFSDVRQQIEVLVILVLAPLAFAERLLGLDKLNALDPL